MRPTLATVLSNTEVMPGVHLLWAEAPDVAAGARPGQFVMVRVGEGPDPLLRRPLSIHRLAPLDRPRRIALLFAVVGRGTALLAQRGEGDRLDILGPLGNGFEIGPGTHRMLLVAGGLGIAPLVALAEEGVRRGLGVTMLQGAATAAQLYPAQMLPPVVALEVATEDGSAGTRCAVPQLVPAVAADQVFACGPLSMYQSMAAVLGGERSVQVSMEARMGCGLGLCYGCTIETRQGPRKVCQDGPVFELEDIVWDGR